MLTTSYGLQALSQTNQLRQQLDFIVSSNLLNTFNQSPVDMAKIPVGQLAALHRQLFHEADRIQKVLYDQLIY